MHNSALCDYKKQGKISFKSKDFRKQRPLFIKAERDNIIRIIGSGEFTLNPMFNCFLDYKISLSFVPSYSILGCFSNFEKHVNEIFPQKRNPGEEEHKRKTMMELLQILTSEDYTIIPEKRKTVFTSILMYKNLDMKQINKYMPVPVKLDSLLFKRLKLLETTSIARNTFFVKEVLGWQEGPVAPFLKSSLSDHFLLSDI